MNCPRCKLPMSESHRIDFRLGPAKRILVCPNQHYAIEDVTSSLAGHRQHVDRAESKRASG